MPATKRNWFIRFMSWIWNGIKKAMGKVKSGFVFLGQKMGLVKTREQIEIDAENYANSFMAGVERLEQEDRKREQEQRAITEAEEKRQHEEMGRKFKESRKYTLRKCIENTGVPANLIRQNSLLKTKYSPINIAVIGERHSGKTKFINTVAGSKIAQNDNWANYPLGEYDPDKNKYKWNDGVSFIECISYGRECETADRGLDDAFNINTIGYKPKYKLDPVNDTFVKSFERPEDAFDIAILMLRPQKSRGVTEKHNKKHYIFDNSNRAALRFILKTKKPFIIISNMPEIDLSDKNASDYQELKEHIELIDRWLKEGIQETIQKETGKVDYMPEIYFTTDNDEEAEFFHTLDGKDIDDIKKAITDRIEKVKTKREKVDLSVDRLKNINGVRVNSL